MGHNYLWEQLKLWNKEYKWVDLTHSLHSETPHWAGWPALHIERAASLEDSLFDAHYYTTVGQYGTHVDSPSHMVKGGRTLDEIGIEEMVYPLCVIDKTKSVEKEDNYCLTVVDVLEWEEVYGRIPENAFVVFQSGWSKRSGKDMDNLDESGKRNFPGWGIGTLKFLVEERNIGGIGHETSDTESPISSEKTNYEVEYYILAQDKIQAELLTNVEWCPPVGGLIFCTFPKVLGGSGYPARCFALCPK